jgi:hypothetical protein
MLFTLLEGQGRVAWFGESARLDALLDECAAMLRHPQLVDLRARDPSAVREHLQAKMHSSSTHMCLYALSAVMEWVRMHAAPSDLSTLSAAYVVDRANEIILREDGGARKSAWDRYYSLHPDTELLERKLLSPKEFALAVGEGPVPPPPPPPVASSVVPSSAPAPEPVASPASADVAVDVNLAH